MSAAAEPGGRWQRRPDAQRLRWAGATQLQRLCAVVEQADAAWRAAWGIAAAAVPVRSTHGIGHADGAGLQPLGQAGAAAAWVRWRHDADASPFAGAPTTPLVAAARAACVRDRAARLAGSLGLEAVSFAPQARRVPEGRWSGAARVLLACGSELVVDGECLAALAPRAPAASMRAAPVAALASAAARRHVHVQARLTDCTLDVGALQGLQAGDVVRLDHALSAPLLLHASGGAPLLRGFLAARGGFKAVELAAVPSSHPTEATP